MPRACPRPESELELPSAGRRAREPSLASARTSSPCRGGHQALPSTGARGSGRQQCSHRESQGQDCAQGPHAAQGSGQRLEGAPQTQGHGGSVHPPRLSLPFPTPGPPGLRPVQLTGGSGHSHLWRHSTGTREEKAALPTDPSQGLVGPCAHPGPCPGPWLILAPQLERGVARMPASMAGHRGPPWNPQGSQACWAGGAGWPGAGQGLSALPMLLLAESLGPSTWQPICGDSHCPQGHSLACTSGGWHTFAWGWRSPCKGSRSIPLEVTESWQGPGSCQGGTRFPVIACPKSGHPQNQPAGQGSYYLPLRGGDGGPGRWGGWRSRGHQGSKAGICAASTRESQAAATVSSFRSPRSCHNLGGQRGLESLVNFIHSLERAGSICQL